MVVRQFLDWYARRYRLEGLEAMHGRLSSAHQEIIRLDERRRGILATRWYSATFVNAMLDAAISPFPADTHASIAVDAAEMIINSSIRGIYKALFQMVATPARHAKYQQKLWDHHYDSGVIETEVLTETSHRSIMRDWRGHHPFACMLNQAAAVPIYINMGMSKVEQQTLACVSLGDDACVGIVSWQP